MSTQSSILDGGPSMQHLRTVRSFLHHGDVTGVGLRYGVDVHRLLEGVRTLEREAAADLAERVRVAQRDLEHLDGDALMVPSTAIILALLVLILLVVA